MKAKITLLSTAATALLWTASATAQTTAAEPETAKNDQTSSPASDQGGVPDIVVTAQKRAENVQNVPIAISAFTSETLKERAVADVSSLSSISPNVTLDASTPFSGSSSVLGATIRGIGSSDFAFNIDPGVGVYLDGVYLGRSIGANQDLLDVERVEVLKGPQGTLFGRNTIGGAISIVTHDPGKDFRFVGDVTTGSFRRMQVRGTLDIPITNELSSSLSFGMLNRQGYQKRIPFVSATPYIIDGASSYAAAGSGGGDRQGGDNSWSLRGKLKWDNGRGFKATLSGDFTNVDQDSTASTLLATTEGVSGPFAGVNGNDLGPAFGFPIQTGLDVITGNSGFLFAGLYNFCIGASAAQISARNATNLCGPRSSVAGYNTLGGLGSANVDSNPANNRLPYDSRFVTGNIDTTYANGNNFSKLQQGGVTLVLDADLGSNAAIKSISAYRRVDFAAGVDADGSPLNLLGVSFTVKQYQLSQELQLTGKALGGRLHYVLGAYAFKEAGDLRDFVTFGEGLLQIDGPGQVKTVNYAGFGQLDFRVNDLIGLTLGGRFTHEDKIYHGAQSDLNGFNYKLFNCVPAGAACAPLVGFPIPSQPFRYYPELPDQQTFDNFSPKAGIQIHPTEKLMLYGSWSRGYKTGGWTTRLSNPLPVAPTFEPEKAETFEIGVKSTLLDRHLQLNAAAFTTTYKGIQLNFQQGISPTIQNAGDARIKGFEIEATVAPGGGFSVQGSVGYVDAYYTSVLGPAQVAPNPLQLGVFAGAALPKAPKWKVNLSPRYEASLGSAKLVVVADWTHTTSMRNDTEGTLLLIRPVTDIVNASVTFKPLGDHWDLTVGGTNLTDQRYIVTGQAQIAGGAIYGTYSRPREWYARVGVKF